MGRHSIVCDWCGDVDTCSTRSCEKHGVIFCSFGCQRLHERTHELFVGTCARNKCRLIPNGTILGIKPWDDVGVFCSGYCARKYCKKRSEKELQKICVVQRVHTTALAAGIGSDYRRVC